MMRYFFLLTLAWSLVGAPFALAQTVEIEQRVFDIAAELRCPVCQSESAADSSSASSIEFRNIIRERLQAGENEAQIVGFFQGKYGDWILLDPPRRGLYLWVWGLPVAAGVFGLSFLAVLLKRWRKNAALPIETSAEDRELVRRELGRL